MKKIVSVMILAIGLVGGVSADTPKVVVFTTSYIPVEAEAGESVLYYELDRGDQILQLLASGLSNDPRTAERQALGRMQTPEGAALIDEMQKSYQGVVLAWTHDVARLPSVLIDDKYLVEGAHSVEAARQAIKESQR